MNLVNKDPQKIVWDLTEHYLNEGMSDKFEIYTKIVECTGIPRPTIRRMVRDFRNNMIKKVKILEQGWDDKAY